MTDPTSRRRSTVLAAAALLAACSRSADVPPPVSPAPVAATAHGIAWQPATSDADIDAAFDRARRENRPVFVYWGAKWCPPCNQVKATLFNRQDFIERSRAFVPVYVDGDGPGAQRLGARFKVSGYPTMVLFSSRGAEVTRLPGEVDAARYTEVLTLGMSAQKPVKDILAQALAGSTALTPDDWRLLAFYSWDTDQQQLAPREGSAALLRQLAATCPADRGDVSRRLQLQALAAAGGGAAPPPTEASRQAVRQLLVDASAARAQTDVLVNGGADIVRALSQRGTPERGEWLGAFDTALERLANDPMLSRADRMAALSARVDLVRIDLPKPAPGAPAPPAPPVPEALRAAIVDTAARDDRDIVDGYERQAVITEAADTLASAGLATEADALLKANLPKSHSPYYLMSMLSQHAKDRGDTAAAIDWSARAFAASEGPATRLQWGASFLGTLVDLAPQDDSRIEKTAQELFTEAGAAPDAFYGRSGRSLGRIGAALQRWDRAGAHAATTRRLQVRLDALCATLPATDPGRAGCAMLLKAPKA